MNEEAKQVVSSIVTHPKTAWMTVFFVNLSEWYIEWVSPVIIALTSILSFVIMLLLLKYHWLNTKKLEMEIKEQIRKSKEVDHAKSH